MWLGTSKAPQNMISHCDFPLWFSVAERNSALPKGTPLSICGRKILLDAINLFVVLYLFNPFLMLIESKPSGTARVLLNVMDCRSTLLAFSHSQKHYLGSLQVCLLLWGIAFGKHIFKICKTCALCVRLVFCKTHTFLLLWCAASGNTVSKTCIFKNVCGGRGGRKTTNGRKKTTTIEQLPDSRSIAPREKRTWVGIPHSDIYTYIYIYAYIYIYTQVEITISNIC